MYLYLYLFKNYTLENARRTQQLDPILDEGANYTATAAFRSEALILENATEAALQEYVREYVDTTIGYADQYSQWALTSVSYNIL